MKRITLIILSFFIINLVKSQCTAPAFTVNLSAVTDTTWTLLGAHRSGVCCGSSNCVTFNVTINPGTELISFDVTNPSPSGSAFYQVNCGVPVSIGTPLCVVGLASPFTITYCKPGGDSPNYIITAGTVVHASHDISIQIVGCTDTLSVSNVQTSSIVWTSIYPGAIGAYNSYLSCTSGCNTTLVTPTGTPPPYVDYQVSGNPNVLCGGYSKDTVRVFFVPHIIGSITPLSPVICASSGDNVTLTASATGGATPYHYHWSTGPNSQSISISSAGTYTVTITDQTNCPPVIISRTIGTIPSAFFSFSYLNYCKNESNPIPIFTNGQPGVFSASPAGLIFVNTATGEIDLAASTAGTYTVTNTIAASGSCPGASSSSNVTINPFPTMTSTSSTSICSGNALNIPLTSTVSSNYTWIANDNLNVSGESLTLQTTSTLNDVLTNVTVGNEIVSYTVIPTSTLSGGCIGAPQIVNITVKPMDNPSFTYSSSTNCQTGVIPTTTITGLLGGAFSSTAGLVFVSTVTGTVDLLASTIGSYIVTYTTNGVCPNAETFPIIITVAPSATFSYTGIPYCQYETDPSPTFAIGSGGGVFSSTAGLIFNNNLTGEVNLALSTSGTYTVTNTIAASGGCAAAVSTSSITITKHESSIFSYSSKVFCQNESNPSPIYSGGAIAGIFTASPAGLSINSSTGEINLVLSTPGTYTITNTIVASAGCPIDVSTYLITITALPVATFNYSSTPYCQDGSDPLPTFSGGGIGGVFSSSSVFLDINSGTGLIDLSNSNNYSYIVTNTIAAADGCPSVSATAPITITALPIATLSYSGTPYCQNASNPTPILAIGGTNGIFTSSPAGLSIESNSGTVDLATSTPGIYTVTNTIAAADGCGIVTANTSITVTVVPSATISYTGSPFCNSNSTPQAVTLTGTPGGTFSAPAVLSIDAASGSITPSTSISGIYTVTYTIAASNGCGVFATTTNVTITTLPTATISYSGTPFCSSNSTPQSVTFLGTSGGTYFSTAGLTIDAVTGDINPSTSTAGSYVVTYTIPAADGCGIVTATTNVTITELPAATISYTGTPFCTSDYSPHSVTLTGTSGGTFSSTAGISINTTTGALTSTGVGGPATITYTIPAANGCGIVTATASVNMTILPTATISYAGTPFCSSNSTPQSVTHTGNSGGTYFSTAGLTIDAFTGEINPSTSTAGTDIVTYTIPAADGCGIVTATTNVTITTLPAATISYAGTPFCNSNSSPQAVSLTGTSGGTFSSGAGLTIDALTGAITPSSSTSGIYTVTYIISPSNGCSAVTSSTSVTINTLPSASILYSSNPFCNTAVPETVTLTGNTGGIYSSTAGLNIDTATGIVTPASSIPGTYTVTYTIAAASGCGVVTASTPVTINAVPSAFASTLGILCYGGTTNVIVAGSGGTSPYTGTGTFIELVGNYNYTITDFNGCTATTSINIPEPSLLVASSSASAILCNGGNSTVTVSETGGTSPYSGDGTYTEIAGTYNYTVTDANGCLSSTSITISEPTSLTTSVSTTLAGCNLSDGSATVNPVGGTGSYTYLWSPIGGSNATANGLSSGNYTVITEDANGCSVIDNVSISNFDAPVVNSYQTNIMCHGLSTGSIDLTVTGGTGAYTFNWNGGAYNTEDLNNIPFGTYLYDVTDAANCQSNGAITINEPDTLITSSTSTSISCHSGTATVTVTSTGGTGTVSGVGIFTVTAGIHSFTVTDANGCTATTSITVTEPDTLIASSTATPILCHGDISIVTISAIGGTGPFWGTGNISEVAGTYTYNVIDANGCIDSTTIIIAEPDTLVASSSSTSILCYGGTADITISAIGGTGSYFGTGIFTVTAGTYTYTVTDANNCSSSTTLTVIEPTPITSSVTTTLAGCGLSDGTATVTATGGTGTLTYLWSPLGGISSTTTGIPAGNYTVEITDANGCSHTDNANISNTNAPTTSTTQIDILCYGLSNGHVDLTVNGGTSPYTFNWNSGTYTTEDLNNMPAGTYSYDVTDASNCQSTGSVIITEPLLLVATISELSSPICSNSSDGQATVLVSGGTVPYIFLWSDFLNTTNDTISTLIGNADYFVTVSDNYGCTSTDTIHVTAPTPVSITANVTDAYCSVNNGSVNIVTTGGTSPYAFLWDDPTSSANDTINNLASGSYTVIATDSNGCTSSYTAIINSISGGAIQISQINNVLCFGDSTGSISINMLGGTAPYTYIWEQDLTNNTGIASSLVSGVYNVTVTDINLCTANETFSITQPISALNSDMTIQNISCYGSSDGNIMVNVQGGTLPYTYFWNNLQNTETITGLSAGNYTVTIYDNNGCVAFSTENVTQPNAIFITDTTTVNSNNTGNIDITVSGGTTPYVYNWSNIETTEDLANLANGIYIVTVTDLNSCFSIDTVIINNNDIELIIPSVFTPNNDGKNDDFEIKNIEDYSTVSIDIFDRWGDVLYKFNGTGIEYSDNSNRWNGKYNGKELPMGGYVFIIIIDDKDPITGVVSIVR